jgi:enoyl-CoA hydratase
MKKLAVNRVMEVSGFRATVKMGAETDALLHYSNPVQSMARNIHAEGLKATMAKFAAGEGWPDESEEDLS